MSDDRKDGPPLAEGLPPFFPMVEDGSAMIRNLSSHGRSMASSTTGVFGPPLPLVEAAAIPKLLQTVIVPGALMPPALPPSEPPRVAELLVSSCTKNRYRKALLNDLDEDFQRDLSKGMTVGRARMRYWGGALRSITPQLWALAKRIGIFGLIADNARRLW